MAETSNYIYKPTPWTSISMAIEGAIKMARATGKNVIIELNDVRFCVNRDTEFQDALNSYLAVKDKVAKAQQQLNQHTM